MVTTSILIKPPETQSEAVCYIPRPISCVNITGAKRLENLQTMTKYFPTHQSAFMHEFTPEQRTAANRILASAVTQLNALGLHCLLSPLSLPHGLTLSLHVATSESTIAAAHTAATHGSALAHTVQGRPAFDGDVADLCADLVIVHASRQ